MLGQKAEEKKSETNLFGVKPPTTGGLFNSNVNNQQQGATNTATTNPSATTNPQPNTGSNPFGNKPATTTPAVNTATNQPATTGANLFSNNNATSNPATNPQSTSNPQQSKFQFYNDLDPTATTSQTGGGIFTNPNPSSTNPQSSTNPLLAPQKN